ncbi:hypothetical protein [Hymenobacter swuensis]|uniref:hypothetical protein n=1 Tax=Hymenobacter swuensis TaxID=1446467 RepID=UPI0005C44052|nr:hypothetical protein [Hymenobacter swuensis]
MFLVLSSFAAIAQQTLPATLTWLVTRVAQSSAEPLPTLPLREAQRTLGTARQRFQQGLPPTARLYLTARVLNEAATPELVVIAVETWQGRQLRGWILRAGSSQQNTQLPVEFVEAAVHDWLLLHTDGREEGNYLGKYWNLEEKLAARPE